MLYREPVLTHCLDPSKVWRNCLFCEDEDINFILINSFLPAIVIIIIILFLNHVVITI